MYISCYIQPQSSFYWHYFAIHESYDRTTPSMRVSSMMWHHVLILVLRSSILSWTNEKGFKLLYVQASEIKCIHIHGNEKDFENTENGSYFVNILEISQKHLEIIK